MTDSAFDGEGHRPGFAAGHQAGPSPIPGGAHRYPELAAAGLWSTPTDLARFLLAVEASMRGEPDALLSRELAEAMTTPAADAPYGLDLELGQDSSWFGHRGGNVGFLSTARLYPAPGTGVVIMTNGAFGMLVIDQFLRPKLAAAMDWPDALPEPAHVPSRPAAGRYGQFRIQECDGGIELVVPGQPVVPLRATDHGWQATAVNLDVRFDNGELVITQDGIATDIRLPRSP